MQILTHQKKMKKKKHKLRAVLCQNNDYFQQNIVENVKIILNKC